jgi:uncharacterized DUF497 family protein
VRFEWWDPAKNVANLRKHGVGLDEARELLASNQDYLEIFDDAHSGDEERFIAIGPIRRGLLVVVWTERSDDVVRIISARFATKGEKALYRAWMEER